MNSSGNEYFFFALMGAVLLISLGFAFFQKTKRDELFTKQADKRGGEFIKGGLIRHSELRLPYKGSALVIYFIPGSRNSAPRTIATLRPDNVILPVIDIRRNDLTQKLMGAFGKERILMNDEEFDRQCIVRSEDPLLPRRILFGGLQQPFLDRSLRSLELRISPQNFQMKMLTIPTNEETFDYFIDTVLAVLQKVL